MTSLDGKVALLTGGRSGLGLSVARRLREAGAVVCTVQRGADDESDWISADLSDQATLDATVTDVVGTVIDRCGRLDILVNNAGVMQQSAVGDMTLEDWNRTLTVNLTAPFKLIRAALPHLSATRGAIVNIGSIEADGSNPGHAAYSASKAGLHGLTRAVAVDHGADGVRCNAVAPGWMDTDLNADYVASAEDPGAFRRRLEEIHPLRRTGSPGDVAALVAFLASDDAGFITGQTFTVDGGRTVQLSLP